MSTDSQHLRNYESQKEQQALRYPTQEHVMPLAPTGYPASPAPRKRRNILLGALIILALLLLLGAGFIAFFPGLFNKPVASTKPIVGTVFFVSSGLISINSTQGINDQLEIDLHNLQAPAVGHDYYGWLLSDKRDSETATLFLGALPVSKGVIHKDYGGDAGHTNLLEHYSQFLITEESADTPPVNPSPDRSTWRYYALLPQTPTPADPQHSRLLDHLRYLLSSDPSLEKQGLHGGLDIWLLKNTEKVMELAGAARDDWQRRDAIGMHRHFVRMLDYLDGATYVQQDVGAGTDLMVEKPTAQVALLQLDPSQDPPAYLYSIGKRLSGILNSPGVTPDQHKLIERINTAVNSATKWLTQVRQDAKQLVMMDETQLLSPDTLSLLDDMAAQALYAYTGQLDPATNVVQPGVVQIHYALQSLARLDVTPYN